MTDTIKVHSINSLSRIARVSVPTLHKYVDLGLVPHVRYGEAEQIGFLPDQVAQIRHALTEKGYKAIRNGCIAPTPTT